MANMKESGVEWVGEIPEEWGGCVPLRFCDGQDSKTSQFDAGKPYIALENVESWTGNILLANEVDQVDSTVATFSSDDVLFGKLRPYLAKVVRPSGAGQCSTELLPIQPKEHVRDYLFWLLINKGFIDTIDSMTYGVKMPRTSWEQIGSIGVPVPPKEEQQTIAVLLDQKCAAIDATTNTLETQISTLERYRTSVIHEAVTRGLNPTAPTKPSNIDWIGNIPQGWNITKVKYLATGPKALFKDGDWIESDVIEPSGIRYLTSGNVGAGFFKRQGIGFISGQTKSRLNCTDVFPGDVIISRLNLPMGRACIVPDDEPKYVVAVDVVVLRGDCFEPRYMVYAMNDECYASELSIMARGSTMSRLSRTMLGNQYVWLPPIDEQKAIADYLDARTVAIDAVIAAKRKQLDVLKRRRQSLIYEYVTGKHRISREG